MGLSILTNFDVKEQNPELPSRTRSLKTGRHITAEDILFGSEPDLLRSVLTSLMAVFCNMPKTSEYVMVTPVSTVSTSSVVPASDQYVNYCSGDYLATSTTSPQILYNQYDTVLLNDINVEGGSLEVFNRGVSLSGSSKLEKLDWTEWGFSFFVVQVGNNFIDNRGGDAMMAISEMQEILTSSLMEASSSGILDEVFKSRNSDIIATSIVGSELDTFRAAISTMIGIHLGDNFVSEDDKSADENTESDDNILIGNEDETMGNSSMTESNVTNIPQRDKSTTHFRISSLQITGFAMLISLITILMVLTKMARDRKQCDSRVELDLSLLADVDDFSDVPSMITGFMS